MPTEANLYQSWMSEISDALKREKSYRGKANKVVELYEAKQPENTPFAIVYSNTETLAPAVYNARPIPMVMRRYKDADPLGKIAAETSTRLLKYLIDIESQDYDPFDELVQAAVLDGLLTNRGLTRFKFVPDDSLGECVYGEAVRWDKFLHGYARTWKKVPWAGFEWDMSKEELQKNFKDVTIDFSKFNDAFDDKDSRGGETREELTGVKTYKVYEIWDKRTGKVMFFSAVYDRGPLRMVDAPIKLSGFFPFPKPLNFMRKSTTLVPTPLYEHYRSQAQELNDLTKRLKAIIRAVKYRGFYNSTIEGIEKVLEADDNVLVPVENVASMPEGMGMDKLLWTVPVAELAATAQQLYTQREQVKQVIYEITGISDILRGASVASETATAQNIKNQWGTLRLKKMQKEVQRYCRESLAIILEIAAASFEVDTIAKMTGLPYLTVEKKQAITMQIQQAEQQAQMQAQMSGQPPQPPQIPPQIQQLLAQPTWDDIQGILRNNIMLHYKTDIETNSTLDAEAAQDKQDIAELLNALSQFLNGVGPLVQQKVLPFTIAKDMLLVIARRFNFGAQLEDSINMMSEPPPENQDPAAEAKAEQAKVEAQASMQEVQMKMKLSQQEFEQKQQLMQMKFQIEQAELKLKEQELQLQERAMGMKLQMQQIQHQQKLQLIAAKGTESPAEERMEAENATV